MPKTLSRSLRTEIFSHGPIVTPTPPSPLTVFHPSPSWLVVFTPDSPLGERSLTEYLSNLRAASGPLFVTVSTVEGAFSL